MTENDNGLIAIPSEYQGRFHNACTDACDMIIGPCACGAWHHIRDWESKDASRMINNACVYDALNTSRVREDREKYKPL